MTKDIFVGSSSSTPFGFAGTDNGTVFWADNGNGTGNKLYVTNGTPGNATLINQGTISADTVGGTLGAPSISLE